MKFCSFVVLSPDLPCGAVIPLMLPSGCKTKKATNQELEKICEKILALPQKKYLHYLFTACP